MGIPQSRVSGRPRLDAFDEEFGHKPVAVLRGQRRKRLRFSTVIIAAFGAAIIAALAWPWAVANGRLYSEVRALLPSLRTASENASGEEQTNRLVRQIEACEVPHHNRQECVELILANATSLFGILVCLRQEALIMEFISNGLFDKKLPLGEDELEGINGS